MMRAEQTMRNAIHEVLSMTTSSHSTFGNHERSQLHRIANDMLRLQDDRRERIATAALQGLCANVQVWQTAVRAEVQERKDGDAIIVREAISLADKLIAELDKPRSAP